jgi:hemoglobin
MTSLFTRLGGVYPIALVVNRFSDQLLSNPIVGAGSENPALKKWHTEDYLSRLAGLKFMRTLWVCNLAGGPFEYSGKSLRDAHFNFHIQPEQFDAVVKELADAIDYYNIPTRERNELLNAFIAQKADVTAGSRVSPYNVESNSAIKCPFGSLF